MRDVRKTKEDNDEGSAEGFIRAFRAFAVVVATIVLGYFLYSSTINADSRFPFKLGLDLAGGSHLVYEADTTGLSEAEIPQLMNTLREVIERRINAFGVAEPIVQVERSSRVVEEAARKERLIVELPGVTDVDQAVQEIGRTPLLEFKLVNKEAAAAQASIEKALEDARADGKDVDPENFKLSQDPYITTGLTGRYLQSAEVLLPQPGGRTNIAVGITFNEEGAQLFEQITKENVGNQLAIFLDGTVMSAPVINTAISGGKAEISGSFTKEEAQELSRSLNFGALPVPIILASTQTIGSSLGESALHAGVVAGVVGFVILGLFMILWYRLPGIIAVLALITYVAIMLALFKLIPVVLTAAGIAGFILSVGLAVDANILIAERIKEELRDGKNLNDAIKEGFDRAWLAIRDSNIAHIIVGLILFWFGTALIKGFALVFGIGVVVSMFSAITISRTLLIVLPVNIQTKLGRFLMNVGSNN